VAGEWKAPNVWALAFKGNSAQPRSQIECQRVKRKRRKRGKRSTKEKKEGWNIGSSVIRGPDAGADAGSGGAPKKARSA